MAGTAAGAGARAGAELVATAPSIRRPHRHSTCRDSTRCDSLPFVDTLEIPLIRKYLFYFSHLPKNHPVVVAAALVLVVVAVVVFGFVLWQLPLFPIGLRIGCALCSPNCHLDIVFAPKRRHRRRRERHTHTFSHMYLFGT